MGRRGYWPLFMAQIGVAGEEKSACEQVKKLANTVNLQQHAALSDTCSSTIELVNSEPLRVHAS
jgi:hypothetical protein